MTHRDAQFEAPMCWGGHNQYTAGQDGQQRQITFLRPSTSVEAELTGTINHLLTSDLFLLRWMIENGFAFDCYHDGDLHSGSWLKANQPGGYKASVVNLIALRRATYSASPCYARCFDARTASPPSLHLR
jgi:hypothetical protein